MFCVLFVLQTAGMSCPPPISPAHPISASAVMGAQKYLHLQTHKGERSCETHEYGYAECLHALMCKPSDPRCQGTRRSLAPARFLHTIHAASRHLSVTRANVSLYSPRWCGYRLFLSFLPLGCSFFGDLWCASVVKSSNKCHMSKLSV